MYDEIAGCFPDIRRRDPKQIAPLTLAYAGDTLYDLFVRSYLIGTKDAGPHELHLMAAKYVCAAGQAAALHRVEATLTDEELSAYKRGRNAHSGTVPKNASVSDYHTASGFEALLGYLYFSGRDERLKQLMTTAIGGE